MKDYKEKLKEIYGKDLENFATVNDAITDGIVPGVWVEVEDLRDWLLSLIIERNTLAEEIDLVSESMAISWQEIVEAERGGF